MNGDWLDVELDWLHGTNGHQKFEIFSQWLSVAIYDIHITCSLKDEVVMTWKSQCWNALRQSALNN